MEIVTEALEAYAEDQGYWLKLCQFGDELDIAILNELDSKQREYSELSQLKGLDRLFFNLITEFLLKESSFSFL